MGEDTLSRTRDFSFCQLVARFANTRSFILSSLIDNIGSYFRTQRRCLALPNCVHPFQTSNLDAAPARPPRRRPGFPTSPGFYAVTFCSVNVSTGTRAVFN